MESKIFKIPGEKIRELIKPMGGCYATDSITIDGNKVLVMIRDEPSFENDSGWFFMSGLESQEYIDDPQNIMIYEVNTIANYDPSIIPFLNFPVGSRLERCSDTDEFELIEEW
ncbi:MAG: DUF2185 domain-containing protein [Saprospiraceae bacterium]|nr:DUF2185 domain-containing protein [Saprospiraceae bacterium]